jgi:hypothetical protein
MRQATSSKHAKPRYRVVENRPGRYVIQIRGLLWGWNTHAGDYGTHIFNTAEEAEKIIKHWLAVEAHKPRVVSEFQ